MVVKKLVSPAEHKENASMQEQSGCSLSLSYVQHSSYTAQLVIILIILAYFPYFEK
jgi:hypothetical protein